MKQASLDTMTTSNSIRPIIIDGGLATEIERYGEDLSHVLWSAKFLQENPSVILAAHDRFFAAGADVATTATYQASLAGFHKSGIGHSQGVRLMQLAVELANTARDLELERRRVASQSDRVWPLVVGSCGPYGAYLGDGSEYSGNYAGVAFEDMKSFHRGRLQALAVTDSMMDFVVFETIPDMAEALAIVDLLREFPILRRRVWMSFSCNTTETLCCGVNFRDTIAHLLKRDRDRHICGVGVNCTPPELVDSLLGHPPLLESVSCHLAKERDILNEGMRVIAYPNSGEVWDTKNNCWGNFPENHIALHERAPVWLASGVTGIGGCCRTYPDDIQELRKVVDRWEARPTAIQHRQQTTTSTATMENDGQEADLDNYDAAAY